MYMQSIERGLEAAPLQPVTGADRVFEYMLNALRLSDGFSESGFTERTGLSAEALQPTLSSLVARKLMEGPEKGLWRPTVLGKRFLNDLQSSFLQD